MKKTIFALVIVLGVAYLILTQKQENDRLSTEMDELRSRYNSESTDNRRLRDKVADLESERNRYNAKMSSQVSPAAIPTPVARPMSTSTAKVNAPPDRAKLKKSLEDRVVTIDDRLRALDEQGSYDLQIEVARDKFKAIGSHLNELKSQLNKIEQARTRILNTGRSSVDASFLKGLNLEQSIGNQESQTNSRINQLQTKLLGLRRQKQSQGVQASIQATQNEIDGLKGQLSGLAGRKALVKSQMAVNARSTEMDVGQQVQYLDKLKNGLKSDIAATDQALVIQQKHLQALVSHNEARTRELEKLQDERGKIRDRILDIK